MAHRVLKIAPVAGATSQRGCRKRGNSPQRESERQVLRDGIHRGRRRTQQQLSELISFVAGDSPSGRGTAAETARKGGLIICFPKCPDWICKFSCDAFMTTTTTIIILIYSAALAGNNADVSKQ